MFKNDTYLIKSNDPNDTLVVTLHDAAGNVLGKSQYFFKSEKKLCKVDIQK
jgi:hypothetical protein